jgi:hypothetical protein
MSAGRGSSEGNTGVRAGKAVECEWTRSQKHAPFAEKKSAKAAAPRTTTPKDNGNSEASSRSQQKVSLIASLAPEIQRLRHAPTTLYD